MNNRIWNDFAFIFIVIKNNKASWTGDKKKYKDSLDCEISFKTLQGGQKCVSGWIKIDEIVIMDRKVRWLLET